MMMPPRTIKNKCVGCQKFLLLHNKIMSCESCDKIVHAECAKFNYEYNHLNNSWQCWDCCNSKNIRYNPFSNITYDKYDPANLNEIEDISEISKLLDNCQSLDRKKLKNFFKDNPEVKSKPSILFNNIDGNSSNFDKFISDISQYCHEFSFIGIAETNVDPCHKDLYTISGYTSAYNKKLANKRKGTGVAIYIKDNLSFKIVESLCCCTENLECLFVEITNLNNPYIIGVVYRPPSGSKTKSQSELDNLMNILPNKKVYIVGDFNDDLFKPDSREFESTIYGNNMIPTVSIATHFKPGCNPSLIDNILTNSIENVIMAGVFESGVSHHHPVVCFIDDNLPKEKDMSNFCPKYDFSENNLYFFDQAMQKLRNTEMDYNEENFRIFAEDIKLRIDENFLVDENCATRSKRSLLFNPWITPGIIVSVSKKHYYYKQWKSSTSKKDKLGNLELYLIFKNYRRELKHIIKNAKKSYYCKRFNNVQGNMKKTWALINELRGKSKKSISSCFKIDSQLVEDNREIATGFNNFFSSIARNMNTKLYSSTPSTHSPVNGKKFTDYLSNRVCSSMFLFECSSNEIGKIIKDFENGKASDLPLTALKKCAQHISGHLSGYINHFMKIGKFPGILKIGKVTPVFKKGDAQEFDNYRPISIIPIFGKIFEKVIYDRLYSFFTTNGVVYDRQFGFRKRHSTGHAINYSINNIIDEIKKRNHVLGIFIDLSKAFDTIDHHKLSIKLEHYGIRGTTLKLLTDYLKNRKQYTNFKGVDSETCNIEYGVPQGSVLGPLLFLIYVNDLVNSSNEGNFILFADDTNIFVAGKNEQEAYDKAQIVLNYVHQYMISNQLHINTTKSVYMHFRPKMNLIERQTCARARIEKSLKLANHNLKKVTKTKFLGVMIDDQLAWDAQIEYLKVKLLSSIVVIKRIKKFIPKSEYLKLYYALFQSHISYCISCWGGVSQNKLESVFSIQKRCIRLLFGKEIGFDHAEYYATCARVRTYEQHIAKKNFALEHTKPIFNEMKLLTLHHLHIYHTFLEVYKVFKFKEPLSIHELFEFSSRSTNINVIIPKISTEIEKYNFVSQSSLIWNSFIKHLMNKCAPNSNGIMIPGSAKGSDLSTHVLGIKRKLKDVLLDVQRLDTPSNQGWNKSNSWFPENFFSI